MTLVYVICESHFHLGIVALKSAVAYSTTRLHLIIISDKHNEGRLRKEYSSWPDTIKERVSCEVIPVWFPKDNYHQWWSMFKPCATQRLFLTSMLPNVDAVLYVDTDVIFVHPIEDFWRMFYAMNEWQMAGMAPETEDFNLNHYLTKALHPFVQPFALNAGLLMMNLTRMRAFDLEGRVMRLQEEFKGRIPYADQDLLNIVFARYPQGIFTFTCRWNFRGEHCNGGALCTDGPIAAVHASRRMLLDNPEPAFITLHRAMLNFKLGQKLVDDFILPLSESLQNTTLTGCTNELKKQLHLLRLSASLVDNITAQAAGTNKT
ncbi:glucoside xylosyltransferase 1 [Rhipicephalus sanguineus]|uniref:glucoside xylosyltransferase 1 n=1 Tax=Rhipicephalus sanguineus TaxID=34632 RepID=UPI0020C36911|nr:glucoside xylosyltransferase 1 [Rhipicephalus sanguineus]